MNSTAGSSDTLTEQFRSCSLLPKTGTCKISFPGIDEAVIADFIETIFSGINNQETPVLKELSSEGLQDTKVDWKRIQYSGVFPVYIESISLVESVSEPLDGNLPIAMGFPGQLLVDRAAFDPASTAYYKSNLDYWHNWLKKIQEDASWAGGLSCNVMTMPAQELENNIDVRPLVLHAIAKDGRAVDRGDSAMQNAISNAFWQTFWATGATRAERGSVFPVAFIPVDRNSPYEFKEPFRERYVSLRRRLFGRSAIVGYILEVITKHRCLLFSTANNRFCLADSFASKEAGVLASDVILALSELNRTGWVDAYTGKNAELFSEWRSYEDDHEFGESWPYGTQGTEKIKAGKHDVSDFLANVKIPAESSGVYRIHRVVPYSGCAYLYQIMQETDQLIQRGKIQDFDDSIIGGTNSTFFLNFPEEYSALHSAMNEPVSLLVENGQTRQIKTLKRASFVIAKDGRAFITTRISNKLNSDALVFEGESSSTTYMDKANKSFRDNQFGPLFFGAVVVGNSIVETFEEIPTEVPPGGWLIGDSEAFGGKLEPCGAAEAQLRIEGSLEPVPIRHAFAIGPLLVQNGEIVSLELSREDFASIKLNKPMTFDETSPLARTELPESLMDCKERGVPPTRFPYDWNVTRAPRSAIGVKVDGTVLLVVVDGRADLKHSVGATLHELAVIMQNLGCVDAMNMDGGGSSVMFVKSEVAVQAKLKDNLRDGIVNLPSDMGGVERLLPVPLVISKKK